MKTFSITILSDEVEAEVINVLQDLSEKGKINFSEEADANQAETEPKPVSEDKAQKMIEDSEIGPYYSEQEAKDILKI